MNNKTVYDQFSEDYDRFVNWESRLALEIPFLVAELASLKQKSIDQVSVLDAACGTGQHVMALSKQGFNCAGADYSEKMVEIARKSAQAENLTIPFKQAGFGQLAKSFGTDMFDSVICLGNSLPHVLTEEELIKTLNDFTEVLRPGGKLIIQNRNFDQVLINRNRWMEPQTHREGGRTWIFSRFYDFATDGRITFNILTLTDQNSNEFEQRIISTRLWPLKQSQLFGFLEHAGFRNIKHYGDLQGSEFDRETSGNLVVTAET